MRNGYKNFVKKKFKNKNQKYNIQTIRPWFLVGKEKK